MIDSRFIASLAFTALGVNFLGGILLVLFNAGSRSVRWYLPFHACLLLWLFAHAGSALWQHHAWAGPLAFAVIMMPLLFTIFAWMETSERPAWHAWIVLVAAAPVVPIVMTGIYGNAPPAVEAAASVWSLTGWIAGSALLWRHSRQGAVAMSGRSDLGKRVLLTFVLLAPLSVVSGILLRSGWFVAVVIPIMTIVVMILIFYGVTRMQFYDIEVRARRTGDIAAETVETERLAVLGELAATIAHEIRNPLTGVRSLAQRLAANEISSEKRQQYAAVILEETGRVEKLVSNLLDTARRGARAVRQENTAPVQLGSVIGDVVMLVAGRAASRGVALRVDIDDALFVSAAREPIAQAALNLLLNAIAHAPANTTVEVTARAREPGVELIVRDRGPGIPAEERARIFEPFYSTRPDGTGLGLSVVRHLAREHDWSVAVNEAPGGGAEFRVVMA